MKYPNETGAKVIAKSLSSWRAWIEMRGEFVGFGRGESLSSWRAWIEIVVKTQVFQGQVVALLMESVD